MKLITLALVAGIVAGTAFGWTFHANPDEMGGSPDPYVRASRPINTKWGIRDVGFSVYCDRSAVMFYVDAILSGNVVYGARFRVQFDDGSPIAPTWDIGSTHKSAHFKGDPSAFIRQMREHGAMKLEVGLYDYGNQHPVFSLDAFEAAWSNCPQERKAQPQSSPLDPPTWIKGEWVNVDDPLHRWSFQLDEVIEQTPEGKRHHYGYSVPARDESQGYNYWLSGWFGDKEYEHRFLNTAKGMMLTELWHKPRREVRFKKVE